MKLSEIFSQLVYGELSQTNLGEHVSGVPTEANQAQILSHINLGVSDLHKRFLLKEGRLTLALQTGRYTYPLTPAYAVSTLESLETTRYIVDTALEPFTGDVNKIEQVHTSYPFELGLNDEADEYSCFTPSTSTLRVAEDIVDGASDLTEQLVTSTLTVVYRTNPKKIIYVPAEDTLDDIEVDLPFTHLVALLYYVASRVHNPIGMSNEFHAGNSWAAKYEMECLRLDGFNLQVDRSSSSTRFERNGYV